MLSELFWERFATRLPFQVGGMESASIPLITAIVLKGKARGTPVRGFYIRKSRKKTGLLKQIEGELGDEPVVLVDDLIHSGSTFLKQITLLQAIDKEIQAVFAIVRYLELDQYSILVDKNISVETIFSLKEIGLERTQATLPRNGSFAARWYFHGINPDLYRVEHKSTPAIDAANVYFGTDDGYVYALAQDSGAEHWRFKVGLRPRGPYTISNLLRADSAVFFTSKNGKVFALNADTGKMLWVFDDADWCTSNIAISAEKKSLFVGINAGWFNKRNYLVALDAENGDEKWRIPTPEQVLTVTVDASNQERIAVGCADGTFLMLRAKDGSQMWSFKTGAKITGNSARIPKIGGIVVGSYDSFLYILEEETGTPVHKIEFEFGIATTPLVIDTHIIVSGLDKKVYCISALTAEILWQFETKGRIFADPVFINGRIFVGSNDSRLYELDPATGKCLSFFQTVERITNPVVYAPETNSYFLATFANELYCLTEKAVSV
ncbi:MAG: PQQ-binding-like beta-propeller repeat protein [Minisyncoccia bacterium]